MKTIKSYYGNTFFELCYSIRKAQSLPLYQINEMADDLKTQVRRICKAVGLHSEYRNYSVDLCLPESFMYIGIDAGKYGQKLLEEAQRRHFKLV